jgi:hypothetical protein
MADEVRKINIIELEIEQDDALADLSKLHKSLTTVKKDIKDLEAEQKELEQQGKKNGVQWQKNAEQIELQKVNVKSLNKEYLAQQKVVSEVLTSNERELGTLEKLTLANKALRKELRELDLTTAEGTERQKEIINEIDGNTEVINQNSDAFVRQKMNIGNYSSALEDLPKILDEYRKRNKDITQELATLNDETDEGAARQKELNEELEENNKIMAHHEKALGAQNLSLEDLGDNLDMLSPRLGRMVSGLKRMTQAAKAFITTPLGIALTALVAIGALIVSGFKNSQILMDEASVSATKWGARWDVINDRMSTGLENNHKLLKLIGDRFKKDNEETGKQVESVGRRLKRLRKEEEESEKTTRRRRKERKGVVDEMKEEVKVAEDLKRAYFALRDEEIKQTVETEKLRRAIEGARLAVKDADKTLEERLAIQDRAIAMDKELLQIEISLAKERERIFREAIGIRKVTKDEEQELADLQADVIRAETTFFRRNKEMAQERLTLINTIRAEEEAAAREKQAQLKQQAEDLQVFLEAEIEIWKLKNKSILETEDKLTQDLINNETDRLFKLANMRAAAVEKAFQDQIITEKERELQLLQIREETGQAIFDLQKQFNDDLEKLAEDSAARIFDLEMIQLEQRLGAEFEIRKKELERWYEEQKKLAAGNAEELLQLDRTMAALREGIRQEERMATIDGFSSIMSNIQTTLQTSFDTQFRIRQDETNKWYEEQLKIVGNSEKAREKLEKEFNERSAKNRKETLAESTFAYKAASTAIIAADTYKGAMAAYASLAGIPVVGPVLGGIAAASTIGMGLSAIRNTWAADPESGVTSLNNIASGEGGGGAGGGVPDPALSSDGGLVVRDLDSNLTESMKSAFVEAWEEAPPKQVLVTDRVTAEQTNQEVIEDLSSV